MCSRHDDAVFSNASSPALFRTRLMFDVEEKKAAFCSLVTKLIKSVKIHFPASVANVRVAMIEKVDGN